MAMPLDRRSVLRASLAAAAAAAAPVPGAVHGGDDQPLQVATLKAGDLTATIGDNSAMGEHRAGYNGVWSLQHAGGKRNVFVPAVAGLNLEHIVNGEHLDIPEVFFEPRNSPMSLRRVGEQEVELHQPPTRTFHVESWTRFRLVAPHYVEMAFRCVPREAVFPHGYLALFWASYMNAPVDKSMYFLGGLDGQRNLWTQLCTQWHNDQSTVRHRDDSFVMSFAKNSRDTLFKSISPLRFDVPFFYGHFDELVWIVMFDRSEGIRLAHSPSGGGGNAELLSTNPAWDFQFVIPTPEVGKEYGFRVRTALRPHCSRAEIVGEFQKWQAELR